MLPIRPDLHPAESPASYLGRCARLNQWPIEQVINPSTWRAIIRTRRLRTTDAYAIHEATGAPVEHLQQGTLAAFPPEVIGEIKPGYGTAASPGWALTQWSSRCRTCHDLGAPWPVHHQTGLAFACIRHREYLSIPCGACSPRRGMFVGGNIDCPHQWDLDPDPIFESHFALQDNLLTRFEQSKHSTADASWLSDLLAVTALVWVDAALQGRSSHLSRTARDTARRRLMGTTRTGRRRVAARLHRPLPGSALNAHLLAASTHHLDDHANLDLAWARAVTADIEAVPGLAARSEPHLRRLHLVTPTDAAPDIHSRWHQEARRAAASWVDAGRNARHVPAALRTASEPLTTPWPLTLARATLLRATITGETTTAAVAALGHHFTHVTQVRRVLTHAPSTAALRDFHDATNRLLAEPETDFADARLAAATTTTIPASTLNRFALHPPTTRTVDAPAAGAVWLWLTRTGGHPVAVPFLDGRALAPLTHALDQWSRTVPPERLLALLEDLNQVEGDLRSTHPDAGRATTPMLRGA